MEQMGMLSTEGKEVIAKENSKTVLNFVIPEKLPKNFKRIERLPTNPKLEQVTKWITQQILENGTYKEALLADTMGVLKKEGIKVPEDIRLNILLNTDKTMYIVIPRKLGNNEELNNIELQAVSGGKGEVREMGNSNKFGFTQINFNVSHSLFLLGNNYGDLTEDNSNY
ncbi:MAG: hypothetical protein S4CHLAM37_07740 [Chlamydiia bacterium]|nr:hypothetical protein [Chlamydiia bacterium]